MKFVAGAMLLCLDFIERMLCWGAARRVCCDKRHYGGASMCVHKAAFKRSCDEMRSNSFHNIGKYCGV